MTDLREMVKSGVREVSHTLLTDTEADAAIVAALEGVRGELPNEAEKIDFLIAQHRGQG